ncbi:hypothetical protein [Streptomyces sp. SLBN-115]|uniref:hypothetical protein n=1 Tax=Streptomyces sp. SLBN-115 TaxID=2768453 RepID=UPI001358A785|nr:hypothetical protein [Streptomyces sp. SLBN-115]
MDLDQWAAGADAELDCPLRWLGAAAPAVLGFCLPLLHGGDLRIDAAQPEGVPHPQCLQAGQVLRQVIERIFDSRCARLPSPSGRTSRGRDWWFGGLLCGCRGVRGWREGDGLVHAGDVVQACLVAVGVLEEAVFVPQPHGGGTVVGVEGGEGGDA